MDWKLEVVIIPVTDIDRAKRFYSEQVGFLLDHDTQVGAGIRVVQLTPPGSACSIVFGSGMGASGSSVNLQLVVSDIEVARAALVEGGVEASPIHHFDNGVQVEGRGEAWNSFLNFHDADGNNWTIQERPAQA